MIVGVTRPSRCCGCIHSAYNIRSSCSFTSSLNALDGMSVMTVKASQKAYFARFAMLNADESPTNTHTHTHTHTHTLDSFTWTSHAHLQDFWDPRSPTTQFQRTPLRGTAHHVIFFPCLLVHPRVMMLLPTISEGDESVQRICIPTLKRIRPRSRWLA